MKFWNNFSNHKKKQRFLEKYVDFVFEIERTRENRIRKRWNPFQIFKNLKKSVKSKW